MTKDIMDAERISDGKKVILKSVSKRIHPLEVEIAGFFGQPSLSLDPRNHCIPILAVLQDSYDFDREILVMPQLKEFFEPIFETVGEVVDCFRQIFEFTLNTTNDDLTYFITRTACWPRYYSIDFGLSRRYDPDKGPPLEEMIRGGDKSAPEHRDGDSCNPFPTDIYYLGNLLDREFIHSHPSTDTDPRLRPTIDEIIKRFYKLCGRLSDWHRAPETRTGHTLLGPTGPQNSANKKCVSQSSSTSTPWRPAQPTKGAPRIYTMTPAQWTADLETRGWAAVKT
ncbi:hypothetical protein C8R43DRAFT_1189593 [Mycena crocata]|nr:hypothetical protein C8R43DRAFT_1189593 [Mycena crocata]